MLDEAVQYYAGRTLAVSEMANWPSVLVMGYLKPSKLSNLLFTLRI